MSNPKRYYAFDSLRAVMMLLGVVIHSAMSYSSSDDRSWPLRAKDTSNFFFFGVDFLHSFRMPVFFLIAGFFGALLYYTQGPEKMLKNRFRRIFLPFLVFLFALNPFVMYAFKYCKAVFNGETPVSSGIHFSSIWSYIPFGLFHLWFLYYLFLISVLVYLLSGIARHISVFSIDNFFERIFKNPAYRLVTLTCISFILLYLKGVESFETSVSWIPEFGILAYFLVFYLTGWLLYRNKELIYTLLHFDFVITLTGIIVFCLKFSYGNSIGLTGLQIINSLITCSLSLGITGLFLRFADIPNLYVNYVVQSAYWIYLVHFFVAVLLTGYLNDWNVSIYLKFFAVLSITTVLCLSSYHFFVRNTFIGIFLNGKKVASALHPKSE